MVGDLDNELRRAMADDAGRVTAPPTLLGEVRRRHRRHIARVRLTAVAVAAAGALPAYQTLVGGVLGGVAQDVMASGPAASSRTIDGFEVTYLPAGMGDRTDGADASNDYTSRYGVWRADGAMVKVTVYRGPITFRELPRMGEELGLRAARHEAGGDIGLKGVLHGSTGTDPRLRTLLWQVHPTAVLQVTTSSDLAETGELLRIAEGIRERQETSRVVDGVEVTYLPEGLRRGGGAGELGRNWSTATKSWSERFQGGGTPVGDRWITVIVIRGGAAKDLATLREHFWLAGPRHTEVGGRKALVSSRPAGDGGGSDLLWVAGDNLGLQLAAGPGIGRDELMRIAEGLRP